MSDVLKPKNRVWRKRGEGLSLTTKGSKDLAGGKRLHLLVAIAHGKGGYLCGTICENGWTLFCTFYTPSFSHSV